ncbi:MAG: glycosyltransferase family 2 protein [Desulfovibrio sp.]|jgi:glycosyltransferase involved in cell wall biosynthesis|nr:glycosyltransferase family 2 protein [Desulfovibrio sp.]
MYKEHTVAVVVPAYNEETQITRVVETMPDFVDHIIIVDDKSADATVSVVERLRSEERRIVLLRHEVNRGVGAAIASGYIWARDNDVDAAAVMAGDGQMDPADLPALLEPVITEGVDYSKGNRLVYEEAFRLMPKVRFFGNAVLSWLTKIASGYWHVADSQTGYAVIGKKALRSVDWDKMYPRYGQPNDLLIRLNVLDMRVRDVPVRPVYHVGEKSGIRVRKVLFSISALLLRMYFWRLWKKYVIRDAHPLVLLIFFGILMFMTGGILFVRLCALWYLDGYAPPMTAMAMLFSFTMGMQSFLFGIWMDMDKNKHLR